MRASILAVVGGLALMTSAQAPLGPTSMPAASVITVQGWPTGSGARRVDQARARSTNGASIVRGFGIKNTRSASAYLTLRLGREAGWSITSGKLESSSVSAGACGETATNRACFVILPLGKTWARRAFLPPNGDPAVAEAPLDHVRPAPYEHRNRPRR